MNSPDLFSSIIGKPWKAGTYGPDEFDCWGLVWFVQRELFDRDLPTIAEPPTDIMGLTRLFQDTAIRSVLEPIEKPVHGCVVELSHSTRPHHVGIWLDTDRGGVLHCYGAYGVQFDRLATMRAAGWSTFKFYAING
jgi:hypothetical protein